jgi:hypothetical protein
MDKIRKYLLVYAVIATTHANKPKAPIAAKHRRQPRVPPRAPRAPPSAPAPALDARPPTAGPRIYGRTPMGLENVLEKKGDYF